METTIDLVAEFVLRAATDLGSNQQSVSDLSFRRRGREISRDISEFEPKCVQLRDENRAPIIRVKIARTKPTRARSGTQTHTMSCPFLFRTARDAAAIPRPELSWSLQICIVVGFSFLKGGAGVSDGV